MENLIKVVLDEGAKMPTKAHETDAGFDLYSPKRVVIPIGAYANIDTGVHIAIPEGYSGEVQSKSGMAFKNHVICITGTVDPGYTGSIAVLLKNDSTNDSFTIEPGQKIAQLVIKKISTANLELVETLEETDRGEGGFGSTGRF